MCNNKLSLLEHCRECRAKCCRGGKFGSPIISEEEEKAICQFLADKVISSTIRRVISPTNWAYYVVEELTEERQCVFLDMESNECLIQSVKPLDCLCYPLKAIYKPKRALIVVQDVSCGQEASGTAHPLYLGPLDWDGLSNPPKEIWLSDIATIVVDTQCPAVEHLSSEFLKAALKVAVKSIGRFDRITYQHWLDDYIGWIERAVALEEIFPSFET